VVKDENTLKQSFQKSRPLRTCLTSKDCDYDHSPYKVITTLFLRTTIMIAILTKYTIYENCDHDCNPHKMSCSKVYRIATIITNCFIRTV